MKNTEKKQMIFDAKVSDRKIVIVPIHTISNTPYNPKSRTNEGAKLKQLINEIENRGLIYPILITTDREVIDGNRRLTACRLLGYKTIECIISDINRNEAFTVVNTTSVPIGGKGWLEIGLGGGYLPDKIKSQYDQIYSLVGTYGIKTLIDKKLGLNILQIAKLVRAVDAKYRLDEVIMLTAEHRLTNKINAAFRSGCSREEKAIALDLIFSSIKA